MKDKLHRSLFLAFLILVLCVPLLFAGQLEVHFINVGQGDSIFVIAPNGKTLLIDAGIHGDMGDLLNPFRYIAGIRPQKRVTIDYLLVTHPDRDHYEGLRCLSKQAPDKSFAITNVLYALPPQPHTLYWTIVQPLIARSLHFDSISVRGPPIDLGEEVRVAVLYPFEPLVTSLPDTNDDSVVLKLTYGDVSFHY